MNRLLAGLAVLPFVASVAVAGQPLTDGQMDRITAGAGFSAYAQAEATGLVGEGGTITTTTATLAQITPFISSEGDIALTVYEWISAVTDHADR